MLFEISSDSKYLNIVDERSGRAMLDWLSSTTWRQTEDFIPTHWAWTNTETW